MKFSDSTLSNTCSKKLSSNFFLLSRKIPLFYPLPSLLSPPPKKNLKSGLPWMVYVVVSLWMTFICSLPPSTFWKKILYWVITPRFCLASRGDQSTVMVPTLRLLVRILGATSGTVDVRSDFKKWRWLMSTDKITVTVWHALALAYCTRSYFCPM